jgi:hypothetical protein
MIRSDSLNLTGWSGKTLLLTLLSAILFFGVLEIVARMDAFQAQLTTPPMGSGHYQLGQKLAYLDREVQKNGRIDCIVIGSSMVDVGFDPEAFARGYREIKGQDIRCFNFGIDSSSAASTHAIARIMLEDYHPRLLIIGTDARDYVVPQDASEIAVLMDTPWIKYRLGDFSLEGWLMDISYFYRYRQHLNRLLRFNYGGTLLNASYHNESLLPNGYTPLEMVSADVNNPPDPNNDSYEVQYYSRIFASYQMIDTNLDALEQTLASNKSDVQILVLEMPVSDGYYYFFGNGKNDQRQFVDAISTLAARYQVPFWQTGSMDLILDNEWADYGHVNRKGAEHFSSWLGSQVAQAEINNMLRVFDQ